MAMGNAEAEAEIAHEKQVEGSTAAGYLNLTHLGDPGKNPLIHFAAAAVLSFLDNALGLGRRAPHSPAHITGNRTRVVRSRARSSLPELGTGHEAVCRFAVTT